MRKKREEDRAHVAFYSTSYFPICGGAAFRGGHTKNIKANRQKAQLLCTNILPSVCMVLVLSIHFLLKAGTSCSGMFFYNSARVLEPCFGRQG